MRVALVVCSDRFAGVERHISVLASELGRRGVDVTVVGGDPGELGKRASSFAFLPARTRREAARALASLGRLDVVDSHMTDADVVAARLARRLGARHVSTRHFAAVRSRRTALRPFLRFVLRRLDAQIAVSRFVQRAIEGASEVVHPGVEAAEGASVRGPVVLVAQRLESEKDTRTALRAWAATSARTSGWRLQIAGDGSERSALEALAAELAIADTVDFLGFRSDVHELMAGAGIFLATAAGEHLGLSVLEAMARATPVVATASGGHLETAGAVPSAALFPDGDPIAAAAMLDDLVRDERRRVRLGADGQAEQRRLFAVAPSAEETLRIYRDARAR